VVLAGAGKLVDGLVGAFSVLRSWSWKLVKKMVDCWGSEEKKQQRDQKTTTNAPRPETDINKREVKRPKVTTTTEPEPELKISRQRTKKKKKEKKKKKKRVQKNIS